MARDFNKPRFTQPQVLRITGLKAPTLQTWVNRDHVDLSQKNPGTGKSRLYSEGDCIRLAIMSRCDKLKLSLALGKDLADSVLEDFEGKKIPRDLRVYLDADRIAVAMSSVSSPRLYRYTLSDDEPGKNTVSDCTAKSRSHPDEPLIIFPIGRIVEKTINAIREEIFSDRTDQPE